MKIAVICSPGRTAQDLGRFCAAALRKLGHDPALGTDNPCRGARAAPACLRPLLQSLHHALLAAWLWRQNAELVLVIKGEQLTPARVASLRRKAPVPWVSWWIDDPGSLYLSRTLSCAYDLFLTNDPTCVEIHRRAGAKGVDWLTFAHDPETHRQVRLTEHQRRRFSADVVFAGRLTPWREEVLTPLVDLGLALWSEPVIAEIRADGAIRRCPLPVGHPLWATRRGDFVWDAELAALYSAAKICVNAHAHGDYDTNMRVFEATACGTLLITEDRPLVHEMFRVGGRDAEVVVYDGPADLAQKVGYYLGNDAERQAIAARGQARCRRQHTYVARMRRLLERIP